MADSVTILAVAGQHSLFGVLQNTGVRVIDVLNDPGTDFIRLEEAIVCRGIQGQCVERAPELTVHKAVLDFVLLDTGKHEAPVRRHHTRVEKELHEALVLVGDYEIRGTLMLRKSSDLIAALNRELSNFFPVITPRLSIVSTDKGPIAAGLAIVNKSRISLLHFQRSGERPPIAAALRRHRAGVQSVIQKKGAEVCLRPSRSYAPWGALGGANRFVKLGRARLQPRMIA